MIDKNLLFLRKYHNMTQEELAEKISVSRQAVAKWESGETMPDLGKCVAIAELFSVTVDDLIRHDAVRKKVPIPPKGKHIFGTVVVGERGQIVVPKKARELFEIKAGDELLILGDEEQRGLSRPDGGTIQLMGQGIDAAKDLFNISPQETAVAKNLTVRENLVLMAKFYGLKRDEAHHRAQEIMAKLSLEEIAHRRAKVLSGGWQRRLSIAMALINSPKILFLDEPTLGLDVLARRSLWRVIDDLRNHVTIVLTTHYMEEAEALSDRVGIMQQGCLIRLGTLEELKEKTHTNSLEQAFVAIVEKEASHALS